MNESMNEVLRLALSLPGEERLRVAEELLASVEPAGACPFDEEWLTEARRRAAKIDAGEGKLSTWAEVRDRARANLPGPTHG
jgi:putative addiction module component (TIGR02574 family)